ncbi:MAG: septum site-determining protein MinD [Clostridia bacterium]|nr:septum site-determining protein MinD [Clostridia bacterium]
MARKIVLTSGKGGVGKTTVCANLGIALSQRGLRVALLDFDIGMNNLDVAMRLDNQVVFDLIDVIEGRCRIAQALLQDVNYPTLYVMPSCHHAKRVISIDQMRHLMSRLQDGFDYVLIDCPAGMETGFRRAVACADEAIVVATPHPYSIKDAQKVIDYLNGSNLLQVSVVVNRVRGDLVCSGEMLDVKQVFALLNAKPLGVLPEDDFVNCNLEAATNNKAYKMLASNLHDGTASIYDCTSRYRGFFGKLRRNAKRNA